MRPDIYEALHRVFGYESLRDGQEAIIEAILDGRDVLSVMPTGAGKSICYQLPAIMLPGIALVVSPLISLMKDQVEALIQAGVRGAYFNSSLSQRQYATALERAKQGLYKIIYVAPERLLTDVFLHFAQNAQISLLAVDEAHCISQWGHDFRPSYTQIKQFVDLLPKRPVVTAFTATATDKVQADIQAQLALREPLCVATGFDRKNLLFAVVKTKERMAYLLDYVKKHVGQSGIVYAATRKNVTEIHAALCDAAVPAARYHAGLPDEERRQNQEDFIYDRKQVVVATSAFGMGIDKSNVSFVIHYNMPLNIEEYYQQAGRAGRDGEPAECILLYAAADVRLGRFMIDRSLDDAAELDGKTRELLREKEYEKLKRMTFYATGKYCLRGYILSYFGEEHERVCQNCSNCLATAGQAAHSANRSKTAKPAEAVDDILFGRLKALRKELADKQNVPAFVVFSDAALRSIASSKPRTLKEFALVHGVGQVKLERYGLAFVALVNDYRADSGQ